MKLTMNEGYTIVPNSLLNSEELTGNEKLSYIALLMYAGKKDKCWPSYDKITKVTQVSRGTQIKINNHLKEKGLIEIEKAVSENGKPCRNNTYRLIQKEEASQTDEANFFEVQADNTGVKELNTPVQTQHTPVQELNTNNKNNNNNKTNIQKLYSDSVAKQLNRVTHVSSRAVNKATQSALCIFNTRTNQNYKPYSTVMNESVSDLVANLIQDGYDENTICEVMEFKLDDFMSPNNIHDMSAAINPFTILGRKFATWKHQLDQYKERQHQKMFEDSKPVEFIPIVNSWEDSKACMN